MERPGERSEHARSSRPGEGMAGWCVQDGKFVRRDLRGRDLRQAEESVHAGAGEWVLGGHNRRGFGDLHKLAAANRFVISAASLNIPLPY